VPHESGLCSRLRPVPCVMGRAEYFWPPGHRLNELLVSSTAEDGTQRAHSLAPTLFSAASTQASLGAFLGDPSSQVISPEFTASAMIV
jgi:hypothetical protein